MYFSVKCMGYQDWKVSSDKRTGQELKIWQKRRCSRGKRRIRRERRQRALYIIVERIGCRLVILGQSFSLFIKTGRDQRIVRGVKIFEIMALWGRFIYLRSVLAQLIWCLSSVADNWSPILSLLESSRDNALRCLLFYLFGDYPCWIYAF